MAMYPLELRGLRDRARLLQEEKADAGGDDVTDPEVKHSSSDMEAAAAAHQGMLATLCKLQNQRQSLA